MELENTPIEKLVELENLIHDDNNTVDDWLVAFDNDVEKARDDLIDAISEALFIKYGYDGENDYNSMYWFAKGLKLQKPQPLRKYIDSDEYFYNNLHKYKINDPIDEYHKRKTQDKFNSQINTEKYVIHTQKANYKSMLDELLSNKPLLRPLPPLEMKPLKPYAQKLFEAQNEELINFFKDFGHDFQSKDIDYLIVNVPHEYELALNLLNQHRKSLKDHEVVTKNKNKDPIVVYYLNSFSNIDDIFNYLENVVFKSERKPFKLTFELSGIFEIPVKQHDEIIRYEYEKRAINAINYKYSSNIPITVQMNADLDKIKFYIESVLHNYEASESSVKLTFVSSVAFSVHRLVKITGKLQLPEELIKSRLIITDNEDDNLCWYRFLAICLYPDMIKRKLNHRTSLARRILCEDHGFPYKTNITNEALNFLNHYEGTTMEEMKLSAQKHKINVNIYEYFGTEQSSSHNGVVTGLYDISEQWFFDKSYKPFNALLYSKGQVLHIMYIKDAEKLTGLLVCPKCKSYIVRGINNHKRFEKHVNKCDGKFKKNFIAEKQSLPYCPHILLNPVYEYCLAHNLKFQPQQYYMTYDFETMENVINETVTKSTTINSRLVPLSVSCCIKYSSGTLTKHFDARDKDFIIHWIEYMFNQAHLIINDKVNFYKQMLNIEDPKEIVHDIQTVTVFGFNSSRFDSNLFKQYFNHKGENCSWSVDNNSLIGSSTALKQFILKSKNISLRFIDAQAFVAGGTLQQFGIDYGGESNSSKGVFPYEAVNTENFNDVLSQTQPFEYKDFYSYLGQRFLITEEEYNLYLEDSKRFQTRWDYLLSYNDNDVEMMLKPIDNLINLNAEYNVDLISNLSLSKNSVCIKYALAYKDFDPSIDYGIINTSNTFIPTINWWSYKCDSYYYQDERFNKLNPNKPQRDLNQVVSEDDFNEFIKLYNNPSTGKCHLCGEHFTNHNKPTLDRIDNDIGHELSNCVLACASCNQLRNRSDDKVTRLRIQLNKYCRLHKLPTTISNEKEYYDLREGITGGLSMVMHRKNIRGVTHINKFKYENQKVISYDTPNIVSHVVGVDFNSLYPSSFSSNYHEFIPYHGGIMYMPGSLIARFECYDESGNRNDEVYKKCMNIIYTKHRYEPNPELIFRAKVKLECPIDKINELINFPPVFRNFDIRNTEDVIGSYMYQYGKKNHISTIDKTDTKLTMTLDTMGEFKSFGCYYLWFLIDHGLKVTDIINLSLYEANKAFHPFVNEFMRKRQDIIAGKSSGNEKFYKISMNGSYGYDGMNTEKYSKVKICDSDKAYQSIVSDTYINGSKIADDTFLIQSNPKSFRCKTCIQTAFFTLDNAKFWYLTFIYDFMFKCLDLDKFHLTSADTDSAYFAIAGNMNESNDQVFKYIIKDKEFYNENIYKFMPNPSINSVYDEKKILGCCVEKYGDNQIALCPKCYTIWNNNGVTKSLKLKGVSLKKNKIVSSDYKDVLDHQSVKLGKNINLQMNHNVMSKITINKNALTGFHNKMIVLPNEACAPFIKGLRANNYEVHEP